MKGNQVEARLLSAAPVNAVPGAVVTISFRVTNTRARAEEYVEALSLPPGWQSIMPSGTFSLQPGEAVARVVSFVVPRTAAAGDVDLGYAVESRRDPSIRDSATVALTVAAVGKLALLVCQTPPRVVAGTEYEALLQVLNQGNSPRDVRLSAISGDEFPVRLDPGDIPLAPGGGATVRVIVTTKKTVAHRFTHVVQVTAKPVSGGKPEEEASATIMVEVTPESTKRVDPHHYLPVKLTTTAHTGSGGSAAQVELSGHGTLSDQGEAEVEFLFRGPDTTGTGYFGSRSEYWLNYAARDLTVSLGDQARTLSPLTDYGSYGRGVGFAVRPAGAGGMELGAYEMASRWTQPAEQSVGAYASAAVGDRAKLKLNLLQRTGSDPREAAKLREGVWSVEADATPCDALHISAEYAMSRLQGSAAAGSDAAYRIDLDGQVGRGTHYAASQIHAGPAFRGGYRDVDLVSTSVSVALGPKTLTHASYRTAQQNLALDATQLSAPDEQLLSLGVQHRVSERWTTGLDYEATSYRDRLPTASYDRQEQSLRLTAGCAARTYSAQAALRLGQQRDRQAAQTHAVQDVTLSGSYRPAAGKVFTLYAAFGSDRLPDARLLGGGTNLGASALWEVGDRLGFRLNCIAYAGQGPAQQASFSVTYGRPTEPNWALEVWQAGPSAGQRGDLELMVSYSRPLMVPIGRKRRIGGIQGIVRDVAEPGSPGKPGVVVSVGGTAAATDRSGRFALADLPPGKYGLSVDADSIGLDRVPNVRLPIEVEVAAGRVSEVEIPITLAARLAGRVAVVTEGAPKLPADSEDAYVTGGPEEGGNATAGAGLAGVVIELASGEEVQRRVTDSGGRFAFERLRPGRWHLKVYESGLPPFHALENPEADLELSPGQKQEIAINVRPVQRRIRMTDDGDSGVIRTESAATGSRSESASLPASPSARAGA